MPAGRLVCVGAWEAGAFVGAVVFGRGASSEIASPFGLQQSEVCELCRVALGQHQTPTSRMVSIAVRLLRQQSPGLRLIVSHAGPEHGHHGGIYAAMNWLVIGTTNRESLIRLNGRLLHPRTVASRYRTRSIDWLREHVAADAAHLRTAPKFRYAMALDAGMRRQLSARVQPYPKALSVERGRSVDSARAGRTLGGSLLLPKPATPPAKRQARFLTRPLHLLHLFTRRRMSDDVLTQEPTAVTTGTERAAETPLICRCGSGPHTTHAGICAIESASPHARRGQLPRSGNRRAAAGIPRTRMGCARCARRRSAGISRAATRRGTVAAVARTGRAVDARHRIG